MRKIPWAPYQEIGVSMPETAGVYMLHIMADDQPELIRRAAGDDHLGVLLVGESEHLLSRGKTLGAAMRWQGGFKTPPSHRPGLEYSTGWGYDFARRFPLERLRLRWVATEDHKLLEAALLESYRWEFLDRPPLNASIGNWRDQPRIGGWLVVDLLKITG